MDAHPTFSDGSNWDRNTLVSDAGPVEELEDGLRLNDVSEASGKVVDTNPGSAAVAMATARTITDINTVQYPEGVESPRPELNRNAKEGKFRYNREFLLQFQSVCKAKPTTLRHLGGISLDPKDHIPPRRFGKGSGAGPSSRQGIIGLDGKDAASFCMGNPATAGTGKLSSEDRLALSAAASHTASVSTSGIQNHGDGSTPMMRTSSHADPGVNAKRTRTRTKRNKKPKAPGEEQQNDDNSIQNQQVMGLELVAPIQALAKRWDMKALRPVDPESPEMAVCKIRCLLNKLTMEKFDSISNQTIAWINKLEKHGHALIQITKLMVEQVMNEPLWSEMFARLCRKIMDQIISNVEDDSIKDNAGKAISGGQLFRKHLLSRCKETFGRRWGKNNATDRSKEDGRDDVEDKMVTSTLFAEGFCAGQKTKQLDLGLIKFIGELFKLQMLTECIVHECAKMLLGKVNNPGEEEMEPLCKLLTAVGGVLDTPKARAHLDVYFSRMKEIMKSSNINARMQYTLLDLIELRERKWVSRMSLAVS